MELKLTKIGNSQGVILPKTLVTQFGFKEKIHADVMNGGIFLTPSAPAKKPRDGWAEDIARAVAEYGPEILEPEDPEWLEIWDDDISDDWVWEPQNNPTAPKSK